MQPLRKERAAAANRSRAADTCKLTATAADYRAHCGKFEALKSAADGTLGERDIPWNRGAG
jgi:hypothetical protein